MVAAVELQFTDGKEHSVEEVSRVSKEFMDVVSSQRPDVARAPGLLITNEDVRSIRRYVRNGLALPTELNQVKQLLGIDDNGIAGLEPEAITALYKDIHSHAASWSSIESEMQKVGSDLYIFSGNLITITGHVVDFIKRLDFYETLTVGDLTPEQIEMMPPVQLGAGDARKIPGLLALIDDLKVYIKEHSESTTRTRDGVAAFKHRLKDEIAPNVTRKINLAASGMSHEESFRLKAEVDRLNVRIEEKLAEYKEYSEWKWIGLVWGLVGIAITSSIYGSKASEALAEKDRLIEEKRQLEQKIRQFDTLMSNLLAFQTDLQDLKARVDSASTGVSNVESLWGLLAGLVESSYGRIKNANNALLLASLVSRFELLTTNWIQIKQQAFDLLTAFNKSLEGPDA